MIFETGELGSDKNHLHLQRHQYYVLPHWQPHESGIGVVKENKTENVSKCTFVWMFQRSISRDIAKLVLVLGRKVILVKWPLVLGDLKEYGQRVKKRTLSCKFDTPFLKESYTWWKEVWMRGFSIHYLTRL